MPPRRSCPSVGRGRRRRADQALLAQFAPEIRRDRLGQRLLVLGDAPRLAGAGDHRRHRPIGQRELQRGGLDADPVARRGFLQARHPGRDCIRCRLVFDVRAAGQDAGTAGTADDDLDALRQRGRHHCVPIPDDNPGLVSRQVLSDPMLLALPAGHPLAGAQALTPADLAAQKWIGVAHKEGVRRRDDVMAACPEAGFVPNIAVEAREPLAALGLVAAGPGVTLVQRSLRQQAPDGLVPREVPWLDYRAALWVAWHRVAQRPLVTHFRGLLERSRLLVPVQKVEALAA